jgi:fatty acid desaturase
MDKAIREEIINLYGKPSNKKAARSIILNWIVFIALAMISFYMFSISIFVYFITSFLTGCALRGFDNLTHDASHFNLFRNKKLHSYLEFLISFPVFRTLKDYRVSHMVHHRNYRRDPMNDPDVLQVKRWGISSENKTPFVQKILFFYVFRQLSCFYLIDNIRFNFLPYIVSKESIIPRILTWSIVLIIVQFTSTWDFLIIGYLIPYFYWLPLIRFTTESSKHTNVNLQDEFSNSRSNIGVFHQLLLHPHNDGFHQMHHLIASIPGYNLKKAYHFLKKHGKIDNKVIESYSPLETSKQLFN